MVLQLEKRRKERKKERKKEERKKEREKERKEKKAVFPFVSTTEFQLQDSCNLLKQFRRTTTTATTTKRFLKEHH